MNEKKRFCIVNKIIIENNGYTNLNEYNYSEAASWINICNKLNQQHERIESLIKTLYKYRKRFGCFNCAFHDYDWFDDGDEFEICRKDDYEGLLYGFCDEWRDIDD